ncbi:MAG: pyruvate dehydrogenase E2 component (dihydrolipoamide acetyltransferase) [Bacteroidia bacterium]|jgi:pyruvate dehydrogenase E2 component (dihydrolipoamide acetyltransferase)
MSLEQVVVPDIGGAEDAEVIELLVAVGDSVEVDQSLIVLESDKASMEIPSTLAGKVTEVLVTIGDQLSEGAVVVAIEVVEGDTPQPGAEEDAGASAEPLEKSEEKPDKAEIQSDKSEEDTDKSGESSASKAAATKNGDASESSSRSSQPAAITKPAPDQPSMEKSSGIYAGPAVRKLAREFGVALEKVTGTGPHGRVLKEDLQQYVSRSLADEGSGGSAIPAVPEVDYAKFGAVEIISRSKMDKVVANNMHRSWLNVPHVTQFDEADISDLEEFRAGLKAEAVKRELKLSPVPFVLKACALALRENPKLNSALANNGDDLVHKQYVHIGMAVDTPAGLVVPVLRDVDRKSIWEIAAEVLELAGKARDRKLKPDEMQGGCFTVSSLGNIGGNGFTPIVNTPEVGILGVSRAAVKPVWDGVAFAPRTMLPLALSYDHRVVNGGDGGRFLSRVVSLLSDIRQLSL